MTDEIKSEPYVSQNPDGSWSVVKDGKVMMSGTNAQCYAWIDRHRTRPLWKLRRFDW